MLQKLQGSFLKMSFPDGWGARACRAGRKVLRFPATSLPMPEGFGTHCPLWYGVSWKATWSASPLNAEGMT